jgi:hypothetical protein
MDKDPSHPPSNIESSDSSSDSDSDSDSSDEDNKDGDNVDKKAVKKRRKAKMKKKTKKVAKKLIKKMMKKEQAKHFCLLLLATMKCPTTTRKFWAKILTINSIPYIWESLSTLMGKTITNGLMICKCTFTGFTLLFGKLCA